MPIVRPEESAGQGDVSRLDPLTRRQTDSISQQEPSDEPKGRRRGYTVMRRIVSRNPKWILLISCHFMASASASGLINPSKSIPLVGRKVVALRGGSIRTPDSRKRRKPRRVSRTRTDGEDTAAHIESESLSGDDPETPLPVVDYILIAHRLSLTRIIRFASTVAATAAVLSCIRTAGLPYASAVWATLHGDTASLPSTVNLTPLDETIAGYLADASRNMLPPRFLPSPGPLLSLVTSLLMWVTLSILLPRWFTHVDVFLNYRRIKPFDDNGKSLLASELRKDLADSGISVLVKIPREQRDFESDGRPHSIRPLHSSPSQAHPRPFYFDLNHRRIYCDVTQSNPRCLDGGPKLHSTVAIRELLSTHAHEGLSKQSRLRLAQERYRSYSNLSLPEPTIRSAFCNRLSSPLAVLQLLGRLLTALEENLVASLFGLVSTLLHHYWSARQSIVSARELAKEVKGNVEDSGSMPVWALRPRAKKGGVRWKKLTAIDLLPGDVFVLSSSDEDVTMPVDALLLEGNCVMNEAVLTGESVPQAKLPLNLEDEKAAGPLDLLGSHRSSVLFAGTSLLYCGMAHGQEMGYDGSYPSLSKKAAAALGRKRVMLLALRTGAYSSRGDLLRALSRNNGHVGAISSPQNEKDAVRLIFSLSIFAIAACASVLRGSQSSEEVSSFRRVIQCTRIIVAAVPSDLPLALSSIAHTCTTLLRESADVACTEPGSLLTAAHVDKVIFDKTGTLTADTQSLSCIVPPAGSTAASPMTNAILAGCHSLVSLGGEHGETRTRLVGDPLDSASLAYSGWAYDEKQDAFVAEGSALECDGDRPIKLWQIKTFPFDSNRRTSSALILVLHNDSRVRIWKVMKGSPDTLLRLVPFGDDSKHAVQDQVDSLEANGVRTIAMAAADLTDDFETMARIFPNGLTPWLADDGNSAKQLVQTTRASCDFVRRDDIETDDMTPGASFEIVGIACFEAAVRPSTKRVITGLKAAGLKVSMLTGDGINAAISVAQNSGLVRSTRVEVLDVYAEQIVCRTLRVGRKQQSDGYLSLEAKERQLSSKTVTLLLEGVISGERSLIATGDAVEMMLGDASSNILDILREHLNEIDIVARASPRQKQEFVLGIQRLGCKHVLMCGDGVNDVAAMKTADVAVALLSGYGEEQLSHDAENERRLDQLTKRSIKSGTSQQETFDEKQGLGGSSAAVSIRIKTYLEESIQQIQGRAILRGKERGLGDDQPCYTGADMKDCAVAAWYAFKNERVRAKLLRRGGAAAARVLADEDKMRGERSNSSPGDRASVESFTTTSAIKPGEASLAASFSCLRPSIAGVDALLRTGIAAAACSLSVQQTIALNCLMSCYNLATLYRDGFRYGKLMWNVELFFYTSISQAGYRASCSPRPLLARSRPSESLFRAEGVMSVLSQAFIHLVTLNGGVKAANELERLYSSPERKTLIRMTPRSINGPRNPFTILSEALVRNVASRDPTQKRKRSVLTLLGRPPFKPNYTTNLVLVMSIFQNAVSAIMTHTGKPFYGSIMESRELCLSIAASFVFSISCIAEIFPTLNRMLELRPMQSRGDQLAFLAFLLIDLGSCFAAQWILTSPWKREKSAHSFQEGDDQDAGALEEKLLGGESKRNRSMLLALFVASTATIISGGFHASS